MNEFILNKIEAERFMCLALRVGELMTQNGGEIYRVEDTVSRILESRVNISNIEVNATYSSIVVSFFYQGEFITAMKKIKDRSNNLHKVCLLNNFSRNFVNKELDVYQGHLRLDEIDNTPAFGIVTRYFGMAFGLGILGFALDLNLLEVIITIISVFLGMYLVRIIRDDGRKYFMETLYSSIIFAAIPMFGKYFGLDINLNGVIITSISILFPGVSLTNAVRDLMNGDMVSGIIGIMQAMFTAMALAVGVGLVLQTYSLLGGGR